MTLKTFPTDEMRRLYTVEGWTLARIGEHAGLSRRAVQDRLRRAGVEMRQRGIVSGSRPDRIPTEELRRLYAEQGWTLARIAEHGGITKQAVHDRLRRAGVDRRQGGFAKGRRPCPPMPDGMREMYVEQRLSLQAIGEKFRTSKKTVARMLDDAGVKRRAMGQAPKLPMLRSIGVGESLLLPAPTRKGTWRSAFYEMAKRAGIGVSIRVVDTATVRLTRTR